MRLDKIIVIGVLTFLMLGLFSWVQNDALVFSFPLVPAFILCIVCAGWVVEKPKFNLVNSSILGFSIAHFLLSPFFLEIVLSFEQQSTLSNSLLFSLLSPIVNSIFVLIAGFNCLEKGNNKLNLGICLTVLIGVFVLFMFPEIQYTHLVFSIFGVLSGSVGLLKKHKKKLFPSLILLAIGMLYFISGVTWLLY